MGSVDQFLQAHAQRGLEPGESIRFMGLLRNPSNITKGIVEIPASYHEFLAVATDRRLILFRTQVEGFNIKALPNATQVHEWRYEELASVHVRAAWWPLAHSGGKAQTITLTPRPGCGPAAEDDAMPGQYYDDTAKPRGPERRYDMYLAVVDLDANTQMFHQFPGWLQQAVASGQFPLSPARQARAEQIVAARKQRAAEEAARFDASVAKAGRTGIKILWIALMLACVAGGAFYAYDAYEDFSNKVSRGKRAEEDQEKVARDRAAVKKGTVPKCEGSVAEGVYYRTQTGGNGETCGNCKVVAKGKASGKPNESDRVLTDKSNPNTEYWCPSDDMYMHTDKELEKDVLAAGRTGRQTLEMGMGAGGALIGGGLFGFLAFRKKKPKVAPIAAR